MNLSFVCLSIAPPSFAPLPFAPLSFVYLSRNPCIDVSSADVV